MITEQRIDAGVRGAGESRVRNTYQPEKPREPAQWIR